MQFLTTALVYPLFDELPTKQSTQLVTNQTLPTRRGSLQVHETLIYSCKGKGGADAQGIYTADGFVVFKGSKARKTVVDSFKEDRFMNRRNALMSQGKLQDVGEVLEFVEDVLFAAPSAASDMVLARSSNGWVDWILPDGRTLNDIERSESTTEQV